MTKSNSLAIGGLLAGATTWGLVWYPLRLLEQAGLPGPSAILAIFLVALLLGLPLTWRAVHEFRFGTGLVLGIGLAAGWANLAYVLGVIHGEVVRVLLLFYLAPLWTVLLSRLLLKERLVLAGYGVIALSLAGALIMLWRPEVGLPWPKNGAEWLGLSAGFAFACSNVLSRKAQALSVAAKSLSVWGGVVAVAFVVVWVDVPSFGRGAAPVLEHGALVAGLGLVMCGVTAVMQYGLTHTPANRAIVILLFELVVAAVAAWFLVDEKLAPRDWLGGAMIVAASLLSGHMEPNARAKQR
ncbi:DMT family transporter [Thiobacter aerophilum]|uniref:DMT family transporter n=1 Tax=Thiobacter aerophilum TaxID=3121275 RepID=A0ABV0ECI3_9BURK